jgi:hypothetical protein
MSGKLRVVLDWLRGFLESMMGAQAYNEAAFRRQIRDLVGDVEADGEAGLEPCPERSRRAVAGPPHNARIRK